MLHGFSIATQQAVVAAAEQTGQYVHDDEKKLKEKPAFNGGRARWRQRRNGLWAKVPWPEPCHRDPRLET